MIQGLCLGGIEPRKGIKNMLLKMKEAMQYLGVSRSTMNRMLERGEIKFVNMSGPGAYKRVIRFNEEDLKQYIKEHTNG